MVWRKEKNKQAAKLEPSEYSTDVAKDEGDNDGALVSLDLRKQYIRDHAIQRTAPKPQNKTVKNGAMDSCIGESAQYSANYENVNPYVLSYYIASSSFIGYYPCAVIGQQPLVAKGCAMKPKDAVKKGWDIELSSGDNLSLEQIKIVTKLDKKYKLKENMVEGVTFRNVFGVRHILFKNTDPNFDYSQPFNPDAFSNGKYEGMSQIDPYHLTPELDDTDLIDPTSINFYNPTYWNLNGKRYHRSHFVILKGDEVADYLKPTYRYGGVPLTQKIYERVYAAERTANEAPQLTMTKRLLIRKMDLDKVQANKRKVRQNLELANEFRDNYGVTIAGKEEEINQIDTNLTDLDNVITTQYQLVRAELGIPAVKFGFSSTGFSGGSEENDMYLEDVEALQGNEMTEIYEAHYARLIPSELSGDLGIKNLEIELNWRSLKIMSDIDKSTVRVNNANADTMLYNASAIDNIDIREKLIKDKNSGYTGIDLRMDPDDES